MTASLDREMLLAYNNQFTGVAMNLFNMVFSVKKSAIIFLLIIGTLTTVYSEANSFKLENNLGMTIKSVFISQSEDNNWGKNLISKPLVADETVVIEFELSNYSDWDILIKDEYNGELVFSDVKIKSEVKVKLTVDPALGEALAIVE